MRKLTIRQETWPLAETFTISRGSRTVAEVVVVELADGDKRGRGECVPYQRYDESMQGVIDAIEDLRAHLEDGLDRIGLQSELPPGAARNAVDCALWDLEAKQAGHRVWEFFGDMVLRPVVSAYTLSLDSAEAMGRAAAKHAQQPLLKLKLAGPEDLDRVTAVRKKAPESRLIVDANEGWSIAQYVDLVPKLAMLGVEMIEQPLPADADQALAGLARPVPVCADESCHVAADVPALLGRYDMVNIKLDKTGGLTEALKLKSAAEATGLGIMVGCMIGTSLAMAPALVVAQGAKIVDLDGPLLLAQDRPEGLKFENALVQPPEAALWG